MLDIRLCSLGAKKIIDLFLGDSFAENGYFDKLN